MSERESVADNSVAENFFSRNKTSQTDRQAGTGSYTIFRTSLHVLPGVPVRLLAIGSRRALLTITCSAIHRILEKICLKHHLFPTHTPKWNGFLIHKGRLLGALVRRQVSSTMVPNQNQKLRWLFCGNRTNHLLESSPSVFHPPRLRSAHTFQASGGREETEDDARTVAFPSSPRSWNTARQLRKAFTRSPRKTIALLNKDESVSRNKAKGPTGTHESKRDRSTEETRDAAVEQQRSMTSPDKSATVDDANQPTTTQSTRTVSTPKKFSRSMTVPYSKRTAIIEDEKPCHTRQTKIKPNSQKRMMTRAMTMPNKSAATNDKSNVKQSRQGKQNDEAEKVQRSFAVPNKSDSPEDMKKNSSSQEGASLEPIETILSYEVLPKAKSMQTPTSSFTWSPKRFRLGQKNMKHEGSLVIKRTVLPKTDEDSSLRTEEMVGFECIESRTTPHGSREATILESKSVKKTSRRSFAPQRDDSRHDMLERDQAVEVRESDYESVIGLQSTTKMGSTSFATRTSRTTTRPRSDSTKVSRLEFAHAHKLASRSFVTNTSKTTRTPSVSTRGNSYRSGTLPRLYSSVANGKRSVAGSEFSRKSSIHTSSTGDEKDLSTYWTDNISNDMDRKSFASKSSYSQSSSQSSSVSSESSSSSDEESYSIATNSTLSTRDSVANKHWDATVLFSRTMLDEACSSESD